ncbi:MAG TPA: Gfo/Idh/MocA family oxidoreductase [Solirubrobacteraceae bacterium]
MASPVQASPARAALGRAALARAASPRLGFLGTGWIGRSRLAAVAGSGVAEVAALADADDAALRAACEIAPGAAVLRDLDELLEAGLDGIVIATPSALHAEQAIAALRSGAAVFCQKPLGRDAEEVAAVVGAAAAADRLLGVDLCYRLTAAAQAIRAEIGCGATGPVHAVDLVFHNAYGPDKPWFLDPRLSGGGCVIDLGTHLVDLLLWTLGFPQVEAVWSRLWRGGAPLDASEEVEDMCIATLELAGGTVARLACSWYSHEGRDAVIEATFRGRDGAASLSNVAGSFYDLAAERRSGTRAELLVAPPDEWSGRTVLAWARRLAEGARFEQDAGELLQVATVIDRIYGR